MHTPNFYPDSQHLAAFSQGKAGEGEADPRVLCREAAGGNLVYSRLTNSRGDGVPAAFEFWEMAYQ